jgi:D-glycero-alpha-D-manno-heptose-7-phosphate kinase
MIISKTPYRISLFGGGTDYPSWYQNYGGQVISTTIDKYIYISLRILPSFFKHKYRIVYSKTENVKKISDIKHPAVREALKFFKIKDGLEIHYDGDLPARSGMGSSSAFVVGLFNVLNSFLKKNYTKKKLSLDCIDFEHKVLNETVGSQDQIAASYGGFNLITFAKDNTFEVSNISKNISYINKLNENLVLVYTGIVRTANDIAKTYVNKLSCFNNKKRMQSILQNVEDAKILIENKRLDDIGRLLHESWMRKKDLSAQVTNDRINFIYNLGMRYGALGGKLLGAGGGGFFLFYVPLEKRSYFLKKINKFLNIPFKFSNNGSQIIFNKN